MTGLVAQQQCVGPLQTPLADVAVTALSYMEKLGSATAIGEQPVKGLIDLACGARMSVGEALTNLVFASVSDLKVSNTVKSLTFSPPNKLSSAQFLTCFNFQRALMSLKVGENVVLVSNSLDPDETPSWASHQDPTCLHMGLWSYLAG